MPLGHSCRPTSVASQKYVNKVVRAFVGSNPQLPSRQRGDESEPALDLVEPGRVRGRVVDVKTGPLCQPSPHLGMLMGGVVVHDQVHL
jgi:hypothetical protein